MFNMQKPFEIHVVRSTGTSFTHSWHRSARAALRELVSYTNRNKGTNPKYSPRSVEVWCMQDNKSHDLEALRWHVEHSTYL